MKILHIPDLALKLYIVIPFYMSYFRCDVKIYTRFSYTNGKDMNLRK